MNNINPSLFNVATTIYKNPNNLDVPTPTSPKIVFAKQNMMFKQVCQAVFRANPKTKALFDYVEASKGKNTLI